MKYVIVKIQTDPFECFYDTYNTIEEICIAYNINKKNLQSIIDGTCKFNYKNTEELKDVKIYIDTSSKNHSILVEWERISELADYNYNKYKTIYEAKIKVEKLCTNNRFTVIESNGNKTAYESIEQYCSEKNISKLTIYSIINGKCNFNNIKTKHLKGVTFVTSAYKSNISKYNDIIEKYLDVKNKVDEIKQGLVDGSGNIDGITNYIVEFENGERRSFDSVLQMCEGLNISSSTYYKIIKNTCTFRCNNTKNLIDAKFYTEQLSEEQNIERKKRAALKD